MTRDEKIRKANFLKDDVRIPQPGEVWRSRYEPHPTFNIARVTPSRVLYRCTCCLHEQPPLSVRSFLATHELWQLPVSPLRQPSNEGLTPDAQYPMIVES